MQTSTEGRKEMITIEQVKKATEGGKRHLLVSFGNTPRCAADTIYLFGLERAGAIRFLSKEDRDAMALVAHTLRWEAGAFSADEDAERPLPLGLGPNFNAKTFADRLGKAVDHITGS